VFRSGLIWLLTAIYFAYNFALYGISFWLPNLIRDLGIHHTGTVGWISALPSLAAIVAMVLLGYLSDRAGERRRFIAFAFVLSAVGFGLCILGGVTHPVLGVLGLCLANAGALAIPAIFWSFQTAMLAGTALAGGIALVNSTGNLAGFAAPYLIGFVKDSSGSATVTLYVTGAIMLVGAALTLAVRRSGARRARPTPPSSSASNSVPS
jgi:nitrate/nitrite transporter NarK